MNLPTVTSQFSGQEIDLLKKTYAKELNETEFALFLAQSKSMDLNPFNKEIYGVKVGGRLVLMTSIGGLRKIAHKSNKYLGCKINITNDEKGVPKFATAIVKKLVGNRVAEFEHTILVDEYDSNQGNWKSMKRTMASKTAEAGALRMAFPSLDGVFEPAEQESLAHSDIEVDVMPEPELESQEPEPIAAAEPSPSAGHLLKLAKNNFVAKRVDSFSKEQLTEFLDWAYKQEKLNPVTKESVAHVEKYLG